MLRSTLLATAALALAAPAHAATLELRAGPVTLAPNQVARTLITNAGTSLCRIRLTVQHNHRQEDGSVVPGQEPDTTVVSLAQTRAAVGLTLELARTRSRRHR